MAESKMPAKRVMFCCESCADNYPEGCGYFDRDDLRVMPNGVWLCDGCFTDCDAYDYGFRDLDEDEEIAKPDWLDLPVPPALVRADLVEPLVEALRFYTGIHEPGLSNPNEGPWGVNSTDFGERARAALAACRKETSND